MLFSDAIFPFKKFDYRILNYGPLNQLLTKQTMTSALIISKSGKNTNYNMDSLLNTRQLFTQLDIR